MKQLRLFAFPKKKQTRLFTLLADYIDDIKLNLRNLSSLENMQSEKMSWMVIILFRDLKFNRMFFYGKSS